MHALPKLKKIKNSLFSLLSATGVKRQKSVCVQFNFTISFVTIPNLKYLT